MSAKQVAAVDFTFGVERVIVMRQMHLTQPSSEVIAAHSEESAETREAMAGHTIDNRRNEVIGRGRVIERLEPTRTLPGRVVVELDEIA